MGNDGGTIAKGQDLRHVHGKAVAHEPVSGGLVCNLTGTPLYAESGSEPICGDAHGQLYHKIRVLQWLMDRKGKSGVAPGKTAPAIASLNDLVSLKPTWSVDGLLQCPVTGLVADAGTGLAYLRPCGCVVSAKLLREISNYEKPKGENAGSSACPQCGVGFAVDCDVVLVNPDPEGEALNKKSMLRLKALGLCHNKKRKGGKGKLAKEKVGKPGKAKAGKVEL